MQGFLFLTVNNKNFKLKINFFLTFANNKKISYKVYLYRRYLYITNLQNYIGIKVRMDTQNILKDYKVSEIEILRKIEK